MDVYVLWYWRDGEPERIHGILHTEAAADARKASLEADEALLVRANLGWRPWRFRIEPMPVEKT